MAKTSTISDFFIWWLDEIAQVTPQRQKRPSDAADVVLCAGGKHGFFPQTLHHCGQDDVLEISSPEELETAFVKLGRSKTRRVQIQLKPDRFVERSLADINLPVSKARLMAGVDVQTNTPFRNSDVDALILSSGVEPGCRYILIKKNELRSLIKSIKTAGLKLQDVVIEKTDGLHRLDRRGIRQLGGRSLLEKTNFALKSAVVVIFAAWLFTAFMAEQSRLRAAAADLSTRIAEVQKQARLAREQYDERLKLLEQMASIRDDKKLANSTVYVWDLLSRALPDDTWLSDLTIEDGSILVSGYSKSAATLIPLLESSEGFDDPEFKSSVVKAPGIDAERFTLSTEIAGSPNS